MSNSLWLHGRLSTGDCEALLGQHGRGEGLFLVRKNRNHRLILSVCHARRVHHIVVSRQGDAMTLGGIPCPDCSNLPLLIDSLHDPAYAAPLACVPTALTKPVPPPEVVKAKVPEAALASGRRVSEGAGHAASAASAKSGAREYVNMDGAGIAAQSEDDTESDYINDHDYVNDEMADLMVKDYVNVDGSGRVLMGTQGYINTDENGNPVPVPTTAPSASAAAVDGEGKGEGYVNVEDYEDLDAAHATYEPAPEAKEPEAYVPLTTPLRRPPVLSRRESMAKLMAHAKRNALRFDPPVKLDDKLLNGIFLIRRSAKLPKDYVLDVYHNGKDLHYQISVKEHPVVAYILDPASPNCRRFPSLQSLVDHYTHACDNIKCRLTQEVKL